MIKQLTHREIILLSILHNHPNHAYAINAIIEDHDLRDRIDLGFSTVYDLLNKLEKRKLIHGAVEIRDKGPSRKIYSLTEEGKNRLVHAIVSEITGSSIHLPPFEVLLFDHTVLSKKELVALLEEYLDNLVKKIKEKYTELGKMSSREDPRVRALSSRSLALWQAERRWITEFIQVL